MKEEKRHCSLLESLTKIEALAKERGRVSVEQIFSILEEKGNAALLIVLSLPCSLPVQIPGFSLPFGVLLSLVGLRLLFSKVPWWPKCIWKRHFSGDKVLFALQKVRRVLHSLRRVTRPRMDFLSNHPLCQRFNGLLVFFLGLCLALPLPIPFSNLLASLPILAFGLGLLEDDGVMTIIAYGLTLLCFSVFTFLFLFLDHLFF